MTPQFSSSGDTSHVTSHISCISLYGRKRHIVDNNKELRSHDEDRMTCSSLAIRPTNAHVTFHQRVSWSHAQPLSHSQDLNVGLRYRPLELLYEAGLDSVRECLVSYIQSLTMGRALMPRDGIHTDMCGSEVESLQTEGLSTATADNTQGLEQLGRH